MPEILSQLGCFFEIITSNFTQRLVNAFTSKGTLERDDLKSKPGYVALVSGFKYGKSKFKQDSIKKGRMLSSEIAKKFTADDYRDFISEISHFDRNSFDKFLTDFCREKRIALDETELREENCCLKNAAFSTIMELIEFYLCKNFYTFWEDHITVDFLHSLTE